MSATSPADPAAVIAEAERIEAIADKLAARPGNYGTYSVIDDPELWKQAEEVLGHTIWVRTDKEPDQLQKMLTQMFDYRDAIHDLRAKANELRGSVRPDKPYPWLTCSWCDRITGCLDYNHCDPCEQAMTIRGNHHKLPSAWIGSIHDYDDVLYEGVKPTRFLPAQIKTKMPWKMRLFGSIRRRDEWRTLAFAEPFANCDVRPLEPTEGYVVFVPVKGEKETTRGGTQLILFRLNAYKWTSKGWQSAPNEHAPRLDFPLEFEATLPMEDLTAAWNDFVIEVDHLNEQRYRDYDAAAAKEQEEQNWHRWKEQTDAAEVERGKGVLDALDAGTRQTSR